MFNKDLKSLVKKDLIFIGAPGSGKGTQAKLLEEFFNVKQLSTGDILRDHIKRETEQGLLAKELEKDGLLFPDEKISEIVKLSITDMDKDHSLILDGYPRTVQQFNYLYQELYHGRHLKDPVIIYFDVDDKTCEYRISKRSLDSKRIDDMDPQIVRNRLELYKNTTRPIVKEAFNIHSKSHGSFRIYPIVANFSIRVTFYQVLRTLIKEHDSDFIDSLFKAHIGKDGYYHLKSNYIINTYLDNSGLLMNLYHPDTMDLIGRVELGVPYEEIEMKMVVYNDDYNDDHIELKHLNEEFNFREIKTNV